MISATEQLEQLKRDVLIRYPFFGSTAAQLEYEEAEGIGELRRQGMLIRFDSVYMAQLTEEERIFLFAHELCHIAFEHDRRGEGKDPVIWQAACDAVINQMLQRDGLVPYPGAVDYPEAAGYDAEQYYEILLEGKLAMELLEGQIQAGPDGSEGTGDEGQERSDVPEADGDKDQEQSDVPQTNGDEEMLQDLKQLELMEGELPSEQKQDHDDSREEEEQDALIAQKRSKAGNSVRRDTRTVSGIGAALPAIDWRLVLRDTINYGMDWSMQHAVLEEGIVRPVLEGIPMPETEIVLDTSWSVDEQLLRSFLRECRHVLQHSKMRVGCFDTIFYGFQEIRTQEDIDTMVFQGGGGTDFNAAVGAFSMRVDNRIIFTDGQAPMPDTPMDAVWVVYGDEKIDPAGGRVIHIPVE